MTSTGDTLLGSSNDRCDHRYRVVLSAKSDNVEHYVENLSRGGLYLRGLERLEPGDDVDVELELPGSYCYSIKCRVAYVLADPAATACGRRPGAGLQIVQSDPGFDDALEYFLHQLGRRSDFVVMASDPECRRMIQEAGYQAIPAPPPELLIEAVARSESPVLGVVVTRSQQQAYLAAAQAGGDPSLVHAIDYLEELDEAMSRFDVRP